jgi:hypothetical protein
MRGPISDGEDNSAKSSGAIVLANNTFYENTEDRTNWSSAAEVHVIGDDVPLVAFNNIIYNTSESDYFVRLEDGSMAYFYSNILDEDRIYKNFNSAWEGDDNFYEDPKLEEDSIHLSEQSPCVDYGLESLVIDGSTYYPPIQDYEGEIRPQSEQFDIGADESPYNNPGVGITVVDQPNVLNINVFPNPVYSSSELRYQISDTRRAKLLIYDTYGRLCETLVDEVQQPGEYTVSWNAENLPSGIYIYRLVAGDEVVSGKIIKR